MTPTGSNTNGQRSPLVLRAAEVGVAAPPATSSDVDIVGMPRRLTLGTARAGAPAAPPVTVAPDDVVRVEYDNGLVLWTRADDLLRERGRKSVSRGDGTQVWDIDPSPRVGETRPHGVERGALGLSIKVLEFFGVDLKKKSAALIGTKFEERQLKGNAPGLYRVSLAPDAKLTPVHDGAALPGDKPLLIFLHGTMSSLAGSFRDLWSGATDEGGQAAALARESIRARYGEQVYAFEHRSLTESPIQNALALAERLPKGAQLHLVSHSRGGLVGELLCLAERDRADDPIQPALLKKLFAADRTVAQQLGLSPLDGDAATQRDKAYDADRDRLVKLVKLLDDKQVKVRRFVRVACPARGTTLASGRLDRWLSVINLLTDNGLIGDVADFLLAIVKERTDPRTLPGVEAMMPGSALTRLLHHPSLVTSADLSVISGDLEPKGRWGQIKLLAIDWFYGSEHDLVVNTGSMVGGIRRPAGAARFLRDQGDQVTHFNYFGNAKSLRWLVNGLARNDGADGGFMPIAQAKQEEPRWRAAVRASRAATTPRPIALVLPGTMGSALTVQGRPVWLDYWALLRGGLEDIAWGAQDVEPADLLDDFYGPLLEHLARTHRVEIFPYDWRQSVRDAAKRLAERLEGLLPDAERSGQPLHIVAHSMGGLVTRAMIADGGEGTRAWRRLTALPNSRLLMLGTPNRGSHEAVRWLTGFNPTQAKLSLLDMTNDVNDIIDIVRRFPGLVELLPFHDDSPFGQAPLWKKLKAELNAPWNPVDEAVLRSAGSTWALLKGAAPDADHMIYVAGCQNATVIDYELVHDEFFYTPRKHIEFIATREGDGTVAWASGRLAGVPTYYAPDTGHDELCSNVDDRRIFRGYVELMTTGKTDQLSTTPPGRARAGALEPERFVLPPQPVTDDLPDEAMVRSLGFGAGRGPRRAAAEKRIASVIDVSVRHGDLTYARHHVLVGHYVGDTIVSGELALDKRLKRALSRRRDLGLYPGPLGTHAVFFNDNPDAKPRGALVVGLGQVGELSPIRLQTSVRDALLDHALQLAQRPRKNKDTGPCRARISSLLVGTGAAGLQLRDSIDAILRGALAANRKLAEAGMDQQVLVDQVEFLELYEDVAIGAAKELAAALRGGELAMQVRWTARCVEEGEGRRQRRSFDADPAWWQRLEITEERRAERLRFVATTDRARAEETLGVGQLRLADAFIEQACGSAASNADVAKTLFEMLLPIRLKESAPDQRNLVLLLDPSSARFPWELLEDRWSQSGKPPAVACGMVRQLKTSEFRPRPAHAFENTVFVVGNPSLDGWLTFPDLAGARREAELVARVCSDKGFATTALIDDKAEAILGGLHAKAWRILHLAGHGEHEFPVVQAATAADAADESSAQAHGGPPTTQFVSGMVIGKNTFLTPGDVEQMRYVPELVFINCCHLGKTQSRPTADFNRLAANLGVQFIRMGVKAVVAAGWAVDDGAALTFAKGFYERLLEGDTFGQAVNAAREAAWAGHPGANTWGAYQCYGDPSYRLLRDGQARTAGAEPVYFAPSELVAEFRNLAEATRMNTKEGEEDAVIMDRLRAKIDQLLKRVPEARRDGWLERADVAAALGIAYGEGRLYAQAVEWLNKALLASRGDCPVSAVEQCANFQVRLAAQEWAAATSGKGSAAQMRALHAQQAGLAARIDAAITELDIINTRASTPERLRLLGSACKRLAVVQLDSALRQDALLKMAQYYRRALDAEPDDSYAFTNWAVACVVLANIDEKYGRGDWRAQLAGMCESQAEHTRQSDDAEPNLWKASGLGDIEVVRLLLDGGDKAASEQRAARAAQLYREAFERGASLREIGSVHEHIDFLLALTAEWPKHVRQALEGIRRSL